MGHLISIYILRMYWRTLRIFGFTKSSWDKQFELGVWDRGPRSQNTINRVSGLCAGGKLIEFGCGGGSLPFLVPRNCYSEYIGYDISEVAIENAKRRARQEGLENIHFEQCDMAKWNGTNGVSLIVVEECLYYLSPATVERFLLQCSRSICSGGLILVIVHSSSKHARTLDVCRRVCRVEDETVIGSRTYLTLTPVRESVVEGHDCRCP